MFRSPGKIALIPLTAALLLPFLSGLAQDPKTSTASGTASAALTTEKAMALAQQGRCKEALPTLRRAASGSGPADTRKQAGVLGLKCAMGMDDRASATELLLQLHKQFPQDPDILFISVHAYSDLSSRTALDLGRLAPKSVPARELNAEALEMQGKWDEAQREYDDILQTDPTTKGVHYLLGRLMLSKPGGDATSLAAAKQEFQ